MEIETSVNISNCYVSNIPINLKSANTISIDIHYVLEEVTDDELSYQAPYQPSRHIELKTRSFTQSCLSQLLVDSRVPCDDYIGEKLALGIERSLSNDHSLREPLFVSFSVAFVETRYVLPPPSRSAYWEVFRRLMEEEHRVASKDLKEDETCSICIDSLEHNGHENIIKMPCLHMFHQGCLFEWLSRQNSCPLCRKVPFEE